MAWLFLFTFALFLATNIDGYFHPNHFRRIVALGVGYITLGSVIGTVLAGGLWRAEGLIMIGLMGPIMGLVFFLNKRWAAALFLAYCIFVLGLVVLDPRLMVSAADLAAMSVFNFWLGFLLVGAFSFVAVYFFVIQRDKAHRLLAEEKAKTDRLLQRIENDLEQAARIQKSLLPKGSPRLEGYDISGLNVSCYEVGGDYYDFIPIDDDRLGIVIADVSGKGISASLLMASLRAALLGEIHAAYDPGRMAARLSDFVFKSSEPTGFITFFFAEIDGRTGELHYVNAGHNPPFVLGAAGRTLTLGSSGFALGMFPGATYETGRVALEPGDLIVLFTDGIPEGRNAQKEFYSEERLRNLVWENRQSSAADLCHKVVEDLYRFASEAETGDDVTLVVVKRIGGK
jgi:serine phosphatase RsbU (regulator of sigma subunit)